MKRLFYFQNIEDLLLEGIPPIALSAIFLRMLKNSSTTSLRMRCSGSKSIGLITISVIVLSLRTPLSS